MIAESIGGVYYSVGMSTICASAGLGLFFSLSAVDYHSSAFISVGLPIVHLLFGLQSVQKA